MDGAAAEFGRKYYRLLFSLPGTVVLVVSAIALTVAMTIVAGAVASFLAILLTLVLALLSRNVLRGVKRLVAVYVIVGSLSFASTLAGSIVGLDAAASMLSPFIIVGGLFLLVLVGPQALLVYAPVALLLPPLMLGWSLTLLSSVATYLAVLLAYTLSVLLTIGLEGLRVTRAVLLSWLNDEYSQLELVASKYSAKKSLPVYIYTYRSGNECLSLVVPKIHFGPFRRAGSASLPYTVQKLLGLNRVIILHGDVGHRLNLVTAEETKRVAEIIASEASRSCSSAAPGCRIVVAGSCHREFRVQPIPSPQLPLVIVDRPGGGIDDIQVDGVHDCVVVDAHNELLSGDPAPEEAQECIRAACRDARPLTRCSIGLYTLSLSEQDANTLGLCKNWVQALILECNGERYALVVFPSNNAEPGARVIVEEVLRRHGLRGTLATIDDHECVGLYSGIAEKVLTNSNLLEAVVEEVVSKAANRLSIATSCSLSIVLVEGRVWDRFYDQLNVIAHRARGLTKAGLLLIPLSVFLPALTGLASMAITGS